MRQSRLIIFALFAVGLGSVAVSALLVHRVSSTAAEIQTLHSPALAAALSLKGLLSHAVQSGYAHQLTGDPRQRAAFRTSLARARRQFVAYARTARAEQPGEETERALLGRIGKLLGELERRAAALSRSTRLPTPDRAGALSGYQALVDRALKALDTLVAHEHREVKQVDRLLRGALGEARLSIWGVAAAVLLLVLGTAVMLQRALGRANAALAEQRRLRDRFVEGSLRVQDDERRRIARELHDETGQALSALAVGLRQLAGPEAPDETHQAAARLQAIAEDLVDGIGRLVDGLHPQLIEDQGLAAALGHLADKTQRAHGVQVDLEVAGAAGVALDAGRALAFYRVAQEALTNAVRHGKATQIDICLVRRAGALRLTVEDDGCGFDAGVAATQGGLGLPGMRERAAALGATLAVESQPGAGTTIAMDLALDSSSPAAEATP
ncbi:MAG: sensor histidine kinase [Myxococcales bacterium]|nr:sensor histidine kinase [Myxococcales bacterium]